MKFPMVSVVVPVYNGRNTIENCIKSVLNLEYPKSRLEIVVVDNDSRDGTVKMLKKYTKHIILLHLKKRGMSNARNFGIVNSSGEIIVSIDADCIIDRRWIKNIIGVFGDKKIGAATGIFLSHTPARRIERYFDRYCIKYYQPSFDGRNTHLQTSIAAFRKEIFYEIGYFDVDVDSAEDMDISERILDRGYKIKFVKKSVLYHKNRTSVNGFIKQAYRDGKSYAYFSMKYKGGLREKDCEMARRNLKSSHLIALFISRLFISIFKKCDDLYVWGPIYSYIQTKSYTLGYMMGRFYKRLFFMHSLFCTFIIINKIFVRCIW